MNVASPVNVDMVYMNRCLELAALGAGHVAPNPMVGAVLVHNGEIIGEGYHERYGEPHAEPNCIRDAIEKGYENQLKDSTIYVSLEPCAHFGKTPPCADLIIHHKIPRVVIGCRDPFPQVNGRGIEKLEAVGINVMVGVLEEACRAINRRFFCFHEQHRPYIILKWAQTADGFIAPLKQSGERLKISNAYTDRLVHRWRSKEAAILIGTQTALLDDPALTTRLWPGHSPARLVIDMDLKLPSSLQVFDQSVKTIVFNTRRHNEESNPAFYQLRNDSDMVNQIIQALYQLKLQSVIVEGGARILQSFIDAGYWDEARVINNREQFIGEGLPAPALAQFTLKETIGVLSDTIEVYQHSA